MSLETEQETAAFDSRPIIIFHKDSFSVVWPEHFPDEIIDLPVVIDEWPKLYRNISHETR